MNPFDQEQKSSGLELNESSLSFLETTAKWARFLAILGFIACGLMIIVSFILILVGISESGRSYGGYGYYRRDPFDGIPMALIGIVYLVGSVIYFFPVLSLNNFATRMLNAITLRDQTSLNSAFENLRNHYRFVGILAIITIAVYILAFFVGIMIAAADGFR